MKFLWNVEFYHVLTFILYIINNSYSMWLLKMLTQICWECSNAINIGMACAHIAHIAYIQIHNSWHRKWIGIIPLMYVSMCSSGFFLSYSCSASQIIQKRMETTIRHRRAFSLFTAPSLSLTLFSFQFFSLSPSVFGNACVCSRCSYWKSFETTPLFLP